MCEDEVHTKEAIDEKIRVVRFLSSILEEEKTTFQRKQNNKVFEMWKIWFELIWIWFDWSQEWHSRKEMKFQLASIFIVTIIT